MNTPFDTIRLVKLLNLKYTMGDLRYFTISFVDFRPKESKQYLCSPFFHQHVQCLSFSMVVFEPSIPHSCSSGFNLLISSRISSPLKFVNFNLLASFSNGMFVVILFIAFKFQTASGFLANSSAAFAASRVAADDLEFFTALTILVTIPVRAPTPPILAKGVTNPQFS